MSYVIPIQRLAVNIDYDVVSLRQHVRQQSRSLGLDLIHQAKLATAATTIARGVLGLQRRTTFVMQLLAEEQPPVFEVACVIAHVGSAEERAQIEQALRLDETRQFVDQLELTHDDDKIRVTLRVALPAPAS